MLILYVLRSHLGLPFALWKDQISQIVSFLKLLWLKKSLGYKVKFKVDEAEKMALFILEDLILFVTAYDQIWTFLFLDLATLMSSFFHLGIILSLEF